VPQASKDLRFVHLDVVDPPDRYAGLWREGNMTGYTSRGLGVGDVPIRFDSRGEICIITLRQTHPG
jgi:predicted MPP superfamily phosphohydrolase